MRQQDPSLPPAVALACERPHRLRPARLRPLRDAQRPGALAGQAVPEGHAQVGVRRRDGHAGQPRHPRRARVRALARFAVRPRVSRLHVDEVPRSACRGRQKTRCEKRLGNKEVQINKALE